MDTRRPTALTDLAGRTHPGHEAEGDPGRTKGQAGEQFAAAKDEVKSEARSAARQVSGSAAAATDRAKEAVGTAAEQVQRKAAEYARQAQTQGINALDQQRHRAAAQARTAAEAAQRAAERFRDGHDDNIANVIQTFGDEVNRLGDYLERQDVNALWRDAQSFARRRPELFLGGMFVAGLALSRFLKASSDRPAPRPGPSGYAGYQNTGGGYREDFGDDFGTDVDYAAFRTETYRRARGTGAHGRSAETPEHGTAAGMADAGQSSGGSAPVGDAAASTGPAAAAAATGIAAVSVRAPAVYTMDIPTSGIPANPLTPADESDPQRLPPEVH